MPALHDGALREHAVSLSAIFVAIVAASDALRAQGGQPFAPPTSIAAFSLNGVAGIADVNRDGSPDVLLPGLFFGTMVTSLDEDGAALAANGPGPNLTPTVGAITSPIAIAMAGGRLDRDQLDDLITVTSCGTVHFHKNLGATRIDRCHFAPDVVLDDFHVAYPISPPMISYVFPVAKVVDFDRDGLADVLVAGGPIDRWTGTTRPGFVALYRGDGVGGFQILRCPLPGNVVDMVVADLDNDGTHDHLAVLMETGGLGVFTYDIVHLAFVGGALVVTGTPQNLGSGRYTALQLADVVGDNNLDYVVAHTLPIGGATAAQVYWFQGDGQGTVSSSVWGTFSLPPNTTGLGEFVPAIRTGDWNRDGHPDVAVLRGFVQPPASYSSAAAVYGNSELLVAMGPNVATAAFATIPLPGFHCYSSTNTAQFALLPLTASPGFLQELDLRRDGSMDLLVTGLRATTSQPTQIVTLANTTPAQPGDGRQEKLGAPSGGVPSHAARIGFEGGRPRPGNSEFACTLLNVQGGSLVGLVWGPVGMANLLQVQGIDVHLVPAEYGYAAIATGSLPGEGFHSYPLPIPAQPALVGDAGWFQYVYYDPASGTFGGTQATGISIGI